MHILVTNDDGPPSQQSSPYVHSFVDNLQKAGHTVSIVLPDTQKSWIGKAHLVGRTLEPTYFRPGPLHTDDGKVSSRPSKDGLEDWILVNGTPASCVQVGLHHFFEEKGPIDLLVSGPNYGRNTTAVFGLSSGTIGGAMEGAVCGKKSIALSYAFDSRNHDPEIIQEASQRSVQLIEYLYKNWPEKDNIDLYNVNVPLREGVSKAKIVYADVLHNRWSNGSSYEEVNMEDEDAGEHEHEIREQAIVDGESDSSVKPKTRLIHRHFKWAPKFKDVYDSVTRAGEGSDGWAVKEGMISVTPLRANFWHVGGYSGEIKLDDEAVSQKEQQRRMVAKIKYPDPYVQPLILKAVKKHLDSFFIHFILEDNPLPTADLINTLQITAYENIDFEHALARSSSSLMNSYIIRKALIRKHYLANTISSWIIKHPESILRKHFKPSIDFELDYSEFLDDALLEAYELHSSFESNTTKENIDKDWWILKPGMSDGGNGIRLFSSFEELQGIFEAWDEASDDEPDDKFNDDDDDCNAATPSGLDRSGNLENREGGGVMTSQLRHFIAQPYIHSPLLLPSKGNRKFHIRVYVLAVGALKVYVYREMLALFAAKEYSPPGASNDENETLASHLTNTCFQDEKTKNSSVFRYWSLEDAAVQPPDWKSRIWSQICQITGEVFEAAARGQMIHFQTVPNAFEIFGVDFLVDDSLNAWILELNAFPDFKQTGKELQETVVGGLFDSTVRVAIKSFFDGNPAKEETLDPMRLVCSIDLGRR